MLGTERLTTQATLERKKFFVFTAKKITITRHATMLKLATLLKKRVVIFTLKEKS